MKKITIMATLALIVLPVIMNAEPPNPRAWYFLLHDAKGNALPDEVGRFQSRSVLNGASRTHETTGFGFVYGNGNLYARFQLGNFGVEWLPGDTLDVLISMKGDPATGARIIMPIPEGYSAIWWGQPVTLGKEYPGEPVRLYPFHLSVSVENNNGVKVFRNSLDSGFLTGQNIVAEDLSSLEGVYSLDSPPQGWHWEPARQLVSLEDFKVQSKESEDGTTEHFYSHDIQFRLVRNE
jgi:hypothetical protein